ncbi:hypothetical protein BDD12DRAFT_808395 [Trichophaea hybrida]|nr:hypothetical protein BDD12DRAFT_808395 [Trichophaea hybrida]
MAEGTVKLVHSVATAEQLSRHEQQLRKQIRDYILTTAANDGTEIDEEKVKCRIYLEESSGRTYAITETETDIIIHHVWDVGLSGVGDKRKMEKLFLECALEPGAIARRDKITTKVANIYRTYRETKEMFENDEQDVPALATRFRAFWMHSRTVLVHGMLWLSMVFTLRMTFYHELLFYHE